MNYSLASALQGMKSPYGMKNWGRYPVETDLIFSDCMDLIDYIKDRASIPLEQDIWNQEKIISLVTSTKWRKLSYFTVWPLTIVFGITATIIMFLGLVCIWSANSCSSKTSMNLFTAAFLATSFATLGLLWIKTYLSRYRRQIEITDYLDSDLSIDQKQNILDVINKLQEGNHQLYVAGNYDVLRSVPRISWTAENWLLLLTDNERHRFAIWLDGRYPVGRLFIRITTNATQKTGTALSKVRLPNTILLFSDKERLAQALKAADTLELDRFQTAWREAFIVLHENYEDHQKYLQGTLDSTAREHFFKKFTPIFATISNNFNQKVETIGRDKLDLEALGASGATKFLRCRNENIEKWLQDILPR